MFMFNVHHNQDDSLSFMAEMGNLRVNINQHHPMIIMISPGNPWVSLVCYGPQLSRTGLAPGPLPSSQSSVLSSDPEPAQLTVTPGVEVASYICGHRLISITWSNNFFTEFCKSWWVFVSEIALLKVAEIKQDYH